MFNDFLCLMSLLFWQHKSKIVNQKVYLHPSCYDFIPEIEAFIIKQYSNMASGEIISKSKNPII